MPALSFSVMKEKLMDGTKCQTIRKLRKRPIKVGDRLVIYWKQRSKNNEHLGVTECTSERVFKLKDVTPQEAWADGFSCKAELWDWFNKRYRTEDILHEKWQRINFKPLGDTKDE